MSFNLKADVFQFQLKQDKLAVIFDNELCPVVAEASSELKLASSDLRKSSRKKENLLKFKLKSDSKPFNWLAIEHTRSIAGEKMVKIFFFFHLEQKLTTFISFVTF